MTGVMRRLACLSLIAIAGCQCVQLRDGLVYACEVEADCVAGEVCVNGYCAPAEGDAGAGGPGGGEAGGSGGSAAGGSGGGEAGGSGGGSATDAGAGGTGGFMSCGERLTGDGGCEPDFETARWPVPPTEPTQYSTDFFGVTDLVTGLRWQEMSTEVGVLKATTCEELGEAWRLPTVIELISIIDFASSTPPLIYSLLYTPLDDPEDGGSNPWYWSSTMLPQDPQGPHGEASAWAVNFETGETMPRDLTERAHIRCVHVTSEGLYTRRYRVDADAGAVEDRRTGLTWQRAAILADDTKSCGEDATWRLPEIRELATLLTWNDVGVKLDAMAFPGGAERRVLSATPKGDAGEELWVVDFVSGRLLYQATEEVELDVRCVRP